MTTLLITYTLFCINCTKRETQEMKQKHEKCNVNTQTHTHTHTHTKTMTDYKGTFWEQLWNHSYQSTCPRIFLNDHQLNEINLVIPENSSRKHTCRVMSTKNFIDCSMNAITYKMLSYCRETALQGTLVLAESGRLELRDNILLIL